MAGVYVHIPFCRWKCNYCAFFSVTGSRQGDVRQVVDQIIAHAREVRRHYPRQSWETLYVGGGTPSALPRGELSRIVEELSDCFGTFSEITTEANPGDATEEFLSEAEETGVTRLSLGVQSLDGACLTAVGREPTTTEQISRIRAAWTGDFAADLICGLPGQTADSIRRDIDVLVALPVNHLSIYDLSVEEGTRLQHDIEFGSIKLPALEPIWQASLEAIAATSLSRYEVANFAAPGHECHHNIGYWNYRDFVGLGPSATSTLSDGGRRLRITQPPDIAAYLSASFFAVEAEVLHRTTRLREYLMLGLRQRSGVSLPKFAAEFGVQLLALAGAAVSRHQEAGLLWVTEEAVGPTPRGMDLLNTILRDIFDELDRGRISNVRATNQNLTSAQARW